MSGLDTLIAKSLYLSIKDSLGQKILQEVEQRLFEKHGINITQSIAEFHKLDSVLKDIFGEKAGGLEKKFLENVVTIQEAESQSFNWITVEDISLAILILEAFADNDKKNILNTVIDEPRVISEILEILEIPQTSGYRKVNVLIQNGMLIPEGFSITHDGKKVTKYKAVFENISIEIEKNKVIVKVQPTNESIENSHIMQIVCS